MRWKEKPLKDYYGWKKWFAWKPVIIDTITDREIAWTKTNREVVWLENVERKFYENFEGSNYYHYRNIK